MQICRVCNTEFGADGFMDMCGVCLESKINEKVTKGSDRDNLLHGAGDDSDLSGGRIQPEKTTLRNCGCPKCLFLARQSGG